ncbi:MAG: YifB family Mg chelatase-like AAA ATPase [Candidatus Paceibacteria bacterium]
MPAKVFSAATIGIDAIPIEVEVDVSGGLHAFHIVGLADKAVEESKERVSSAIKNSGAKPPIKYNRRITVNLAPADIKKEGAGYDLAIAVGFLLASGQLFPFDCSKKIFLGELSLDGKVRRVSGILPIIEMAIHRGFKEAYVPKANLFEINFFKNIEIIPISSLEELVGYLEGKIEIPKFKRISLESMLNAPSGEHFDMAEIAGQEVAKRALEIAAAGGHNVLFYGPPGTGKTLLAKALPGILPRLEPEEAIEVTKIYSVAGLLNEAEPIIKRRPFRAPHHSASSVAIIGGGTNPKPGEVSLAHRGVLFLDEFPEFARSVIENLRQPMEDGTVRVSRAKGSVAFPAKFMLVAAMNPCPCGWYGDPQHECQCGLGAIIKYRRKISGPILDRIDIAVAVSRIGYEKLQSGTTHRSSVEIRKNVEAARGIQKARFQKYGNKIFANAEMGPKDIKKFCALSENSHKLLSQAEIKYGLSPRAIHRILKTSRTIADLDNSEKIKEAHLAEALQYRGMAQERFF